MSYLSEIQEANRFLSEDPRTLFLGQSVKYPGQAIHKTLSLVPMEKRIELPVIEEFQLGHSIGLSLEGFIPVSIYPRFDFLLLACNQLVNHLDKIPLMTGFKPKVIIRTSVGSTWPVDCGLQHSQNHTEAMRLMLKSVEVIELTKESQVMPFYQHALNTPNSVLIVEHAGLY